MTVTGLAAMPAKMLLTGVCFYLIPLYLVKEGSTQAVAGRVAHSLQQPIHAVDHAFAQLRDLRSAVFADQRALRRDRHRLAQAHQHHGREDPGHAATGQQQHAANAGDNQPAAHQPVHAFARGGRLAVTGASKTIITA